MEAEERVKVAEERLSTRTMLKIVAFLVTVLLVVVVVLTLQVQSRNTNIDEVQASAKVTQEAADKARVAAVNAEAILRQAIQANDTEAARAAVKLISDIKKELDEINKRLGGTP